MLNQCAQALDDCGNQYRCDKELGICIRPEALRPFHVALQISPVAGPDGLVSRWKIESGTPTGIPPGGKIVIPRAVTVSGQVRGLRPDGTDQTIVAEVAFVPDPSGASSYLTSPDSTFTQVLAPNGTPENRFNKSLNPNTSYQAQVFPLGMDSVWFPPVTFSLQTESADQPNRIFPYPRDSSNTLETFNANMADENENEVPNGLKVRLQEKGTGRVVSSLGTTGKRLAMGGENPNGEMDVPGAFSLRAPKAVLDSLSNYELVLGLETVRSPWLVSIAFDGARLRRDGKVTMPLLPQPVQFVGTVEAGQATEAPMDVGAEVTFVSNFPLPDETGTTDLRGLDWCRLRQLGSPQGTFRCSARVTASVASDGQVTANLLPGDYQVFLKPTAEGAERSRRVVTKVKPARIQTQYDGTPQATQMFDVSGTAAMFLGRVTSPRNELMPLVKVTAKALGIVYDLDEVARYNRTGEDVSDKDGQFEFAIDVGYYDLIAEPPEGSGFASHLQYNRLIADASTNSIHIKPSFPVPARGTLVTEEGRPVANARVEAYAIVPNLEPEGERAVLIAGATSSDAGTFTLLLPPCIGAPAECGQGDAGVNVDASVQLEAGALDAGVPPPADGSAGD